MLLFDILDNHLSYVEDSRRIQDTSLPAWLGLKIYWSALVPQTHIPLIDPLKHYHSQLAVAAHPPHPPPHSIFWSMKVPTIVKPPPPTAKVGSEPIDSYVWRKRGELCVLQSGPWVQSERPGRQRWRWRPDGNCSSLNKIEKKIMIGAYVEQMHSPEMWNHLVSQSVKQG